MMSQPLNRQTLENMKRADLQRLCKDHGIKANLKSEALVNLLLDTLQPLPRLSQQPLASAQPKRTPSFRTVSRSSVGSRQSQRGLSSSSVIIHDTEGEDEHPEGSQPTSVPPEPQPGPPSSQSPTGFRTRKSRQTQYRLGVGRPTVAGGSGARALTKSVSLTRTKRGKGSSSVKPSEDVIQEEEEPSETTGPIAGPSGTAHDTSHILQAPDSSATALSAGMLSHMDQNIQPLKDQIGQLQSQLQRLTAEVAVVDSLRTEVRQLTAEVETLRTNFAKMAVLEAEVHRLTEVRPASADRTVGSTALQSTKGAGKARATDVPDDQPAAIDVGEGPRPHPGFAPNILGKHPRDPEDSQLAGVADVGKEGDDLTHRVIRPTKKRAKLSPPTPTAPPIEDAPPTTECTPTASPPGSVVTPSAPAFTIFSGPEEPLDSYLDPPPPTTHLSDLLDLPPGNIGRYGVNGATTATANAQENNAQENNAHHTNAFNFSFTGAAFRPLTSTPAGPYGDDMPAFTYPEPPTSPTPTVAVAPSGGYVERAGGRRERNDLFHPHRRARSASHSRPPSRASTQADSDSGEGTINPSTLMSTPLPVVAEQDAEPAVEAPVASSSEIGHGFGLGSGSLSLPPETPGPPLKRTMYGTELEGDTRFGDFGMEGVATGFWTSTAPRF